MRTKWYLLVSFFIVLAMLSGPAIAAPKPTSVAELALYRGPDRQQILEAGAKKEGKLTLYTTAVLVGGVRPLVDAFNKKYPYIKVEIWRAGGNQLTARILEESKAGKNAFDVIGASQYDESIFEDYGVLQPFYSPSLAFMEEGAVARAPGGDAFALGHYETGYGVAYNTKLVGGKEAPKSYRDLLDPKWKGKMAITGTTTSIKWMGTQLVHFGMDHVKKLAAQNMSVHMISARALLDLVIAQEYAIAPAIGDAQVINSKNKGAPVEYIPLEPVHMALGSIMLAKASPNPHAAMLFIDFDTSKEAGEIWKGAGYDSPRKDIPSSRNYKKYYGARTTKEYMEWQALFGKLFLKK